MYEQPHRPATATTGKTVLTIVASLSLMLSLFAIAQPVAADHSGFDHQPLPIDTSEFGAAEGECDDANLEPGQVLLHWIASQQNVTEAITLTLFLQGGGELTADSYKWNTPAHVDDNVTHQFEFIVDGDVIVDDLDLSTHEGNVRLSHVCRGDEGTPAPDLTIEKSADATSVNADDSFSYTITVENTGDADATGVVISDDLDDSLTVDGATFSVDAGASTDCTIGTGNSISCDVGTLAAGSVATATIDVTTSAESCDEVVNTSTVDSNEQEPENSNEVTVGVVCEAAPGGPDMIIEKSAEVEGQPISSIAIGESYDYVLTVSNTGDATATGVMVTDNLDDELTIDGISSSQGTCSITDPANNHIACDLGEIDAGGSATVTVNVTATIGAPGNPICRSAVDNVASASAENESGEADDNNDSNEVVVEIDCSQVGSLKVRKVDEVGNRLAGAIFTVEGQEGTFTTGEDGSFCITGLPFGEVLTVTEIQAPEGFQIVGEGTAEVSVDPDGDCDSPEAIFVNTPAGEEAPETGTLEIHKATNPAGSQESFAFMATFGDPAGFALSDGGVLAATELPVGDYSVWEILTEEQLTAGWALSAITCSADGDAAVDLDADKVTVSVDAGDAIVCTFENALVSEGTEGNQGGPGGGTLGGNPLPNTAMESGATDTAATTVLALVMLGLLGVAGAAARAEVRRRR